MNLDQFKAAVRVFPGDVAARWRSEFIGAFATTTSPFYKKNIETLKVCTDGRFYEGYLWDCIRPFERISFADFRTELIRLEAPLMAMWDLHSRDKIRIPDYWKFERDAVLLAKGRTLAEGLQHLPEDIYVFDESLTWTLIETHEFERNERICARASALAGRPRVTH